MADIKPPPISSPTQCFVQMWQTKKFADQTFTFPGTDKSIKVHRSILATWSPVFETMFFGSMPQEETIDLPEHHPEGFKFMLNYMYIECIELPSVDLAVHIYELANRYQVVHLKTVCSKYLMDSVTPEYVPLVMNVATLLDDESLINKCNGIIQTSADDVFSSSYVGDFSSNSLQQVLDSDFYISSETIVFQGLLTWGKAQLTLRGEEITPTSLRQKIDQFLPQVRFLTMTIPDFIQHVLEADILEKEETKRILQILANDLGVDIPEACSHSKIPRRNNLEDINFEAIGDNAGATSDRYEQYPRKAFNRHGTPGEWHNMWHADEFKGLPQRIWYVFPTPRVVRRFSFRSCPGGEVAGRKLAVSDGPTKYHFFGTNAPDCKDETKHVILFEDRSGTAFTEMNDPKIGEIPNPGAFKCYGFKVFDSFGRTNSHIKYCCMSHIHFYAIKQ